MHRFPFLRAREFTLGLGLVLLFGTPVAAQDATPPSPVVTLPATGDPADCEAVARPLADYEALVGAPIPATPAVYKAITGEPADQATIDAITQTMLQVSACNATGEPRRSGGLYTDAGFVEDTLGIDEEGIAYFASTPTPPDKEGMVIFDITGVQVLPDGRVGAIVLFGPGGIYGASYMIFAREGGRYLMDHWVDEPFNLSPDWEAMAAATPTP